MSPRKDATNYVGACRAHLQAVNSDITRLRTMLRDEQRKRRALRWQLFLTWMKLLRGLAA